MSPLLSPSPCLQVEKLGPREGKHSLFYALHTKLMSPRVQAFKIVVDAV
jgi:hypothetical protein